MVAFLQAGFGARAAYFCHCLYNFVPRTPVRFQLQDHVVLDLREIATARRAVLLFLLLLILFLLLLVVVVVVVHTVQLSRNSERSTLGAGVMAKMPLNPSIT